MKTHGEPTDARSRSAASSIPWVPPRCSWPCAVGPALADKTLLNVSYDPTREFYKEFNEAFAADWKAKTGETVTIDQSTAARASRPAR